MIISVLPSEVESLHDGAVVLEGDAASDQPGVVLEHLPGRVYQRVTLDRLRRLEAGAREVQDHCVRNDEILWGV